MSVPVCLVIGATAALFVLAGAFALGAIIANIRPNLHKIRAALSGRGWFGDA